MKTLLRYSFSLISGLLVWGTPLSAVSTEAQASQVVLEGAGRSSFMFLINSDPQMGEESRPKKGIQILNELLALFVEETNARVGKDKPAFVVWNGDLVWNSLPLAFANFEKIISHLKFPSVLVHGNHDGDEHDPQFLDLQGRISGYRHLNYAFDYGKWHFVVMASQPKYNSPEKKAEMLRWLDKELKKNAHKPVMLFMHYHLLPVGLSQMEYYSYTPASFRKEILDTVTRYGNVKYVFSGHVHSGIKSSIKSSREYKGTQFVVVPTPVFQRPFGEEYPEFSDPGRYDKRGYYLEVHVDGEKVQLVGRKIKHPYAKPFPAKFQSFSLEQDSRSFMPESEQTANNQLLNGGFSKDLRGWQISYRYRRDNKPMFTNVVRKGQNVLRQVAGFGSWSFDEYQETYQLVDWKKLRPNVLTYHFTPKRFSKGGAGGYIRVFSYLKNGTPGPRVLFHWGHQENKVHHMPISWLYNSNGDMDIFGFSRKLNNGEHVTSYSLPIAEGEPVRLDVNLKTLFAEFSGGDVSADIDKIGIAHGVWTRISRSGRPFTSELRVDAVRFSHDKNDVPGHTILMNNQAVGDEHKDSFSPYQHKLFPPPSSSKAVKAQ